jgi:hypothetical protein
MGDTVSFRTTQAGTYRIAVGRDAAPAPNTTGTYALTISASTTMGPLLHSGHNLPLAAAAQCGYTFSAPGSWNCANGVSCQDVYDVTTIGATTPITVAVTSVTGNSVVRMAVFDGAALDTTNRLNGGLADRSCAGRNANDRATATGLSSGQHRVAIGRDWASSLGASGTYTVTISTTDQPLSPGGKTAIGIASSFARISCP